MAMFDEFRDDDPSLHQAARFALTVGVLGIVVLVGAAAGIKAGLGPRPLLALSAPTMLFAGGIWAFVRTYRAWRHYRVWFAWQGAGWFLLLLALTVLTMSLSLFG